jgi:hypothetical protein
MLEEVSLVDEVKPEEPLPEEQIHEEIEKHEPCSI